MVREYSTEDLRDKLLNPDEQLDLQERFYLVDVLSHASYVHKHIPGALSLPLAELRRSAGRLLPEKDVEVITYCSNPSSEYSLDAARWLEANGYKRVGHYAGGLRGWQAAQLTFDIADERSVRPEARIAPGTPRPEARL